LNGYNVEKAITFLINEIVKNIDEKDLKSINDLNSVKLKKSNHSNKKQCC
jgi:hypothetical protein